MLEAFSKIGSDDLNERREAGRQILDHASKSPKELEYSVVRLIRGLESSNMSTRTGSYASLAALLSMGKLDPSELRQIVSKTLVTDQETSKKERRIVYIARILASGVILRTVDIPQLTKDDDTILTEILQDLVELGSRRSTLLNLATPFICHLIETKELNQTHFDDIVWPALQPMFSTVLKVEKDEGEGEGGEGEEEVAVEKETKGDKSAALLNIALLCSDRGFKTDFGFFSDMNKLVPILLSANRNSIEQLVSLVLQHTMKTSSTEEFWTALVSQIRSSHFEIVCMCVKKSVEYGISHAYMIREEIVAPLLGVFLHEDPTDQHERAVNALGSLLKWTTEMGKKERKSAMKVLFGGSPSILHEYKKLVRILNPFLKEVCTEKDLANLSGILEKVLGKEALSVRLAITAIQFMSRIAQARKSSAELKTTVGKKLLQIGFQKEMLNILKHDDNKQEKEGDEATKKNVEDDDETLGKQQLLATSSLDAFQSLMTSGFCPEFLDNIFQFVVEELDGFTAESKIKKSVKKVEKLRGKVHDGNLKFLLGAYGIQLVVEQNKVLDDAETMLEELLTISKSAGDDATTDIVKFFLSSVVKDERPPFDFEAMFQKLLVDDKITEAEIQQFADVIDVDVDDEADEEEEDSDNEDEDEEMEIDDEEKDAEDDEVEKQPSFKKLASKVDKGSDDEDDDDSDGLSSVDMDEATEEDLKMMDKALAKVFANKKKVKEEETYETRSLMRTLRLLECILIRKSKSCPISIPLILLVPIIHALQHSIRGKKGSSTLSPRIVSLLDKLNAIKKVEDVSSVETGTFYVMARDLVEMSKSSRNKIIQDLLGDSIVMLTKCYLEASKEKKATKGEAIGFITLYKGMMDLTGDKRNKGMGFASNLISSALTTLPNWEDGKGEICQRILEIIFAPEIRAFRRMQFLVLLRAALADKNAATSSWKRQALKDLMKQAGNYLSSSSDDKDMKSFTRELLMTLSDSRSDPELTKLISASFVKLAKNSKVAEKVSQVSKNSNQLRGFLVNAGLDSLVVIKPKDSKKKLEKESVTPQNKEKVKKRKSNTNGETPSKKKKTKTN